MLPEWVTDELIEAAAKASFENWGGIAAPHQKEGGDGVGSNESREEPEGGGSEERGDGFLSAGPGTGADARRALPTWERQFKVDKLAWMSDMRAGLEVIFGRMRQLQVQGELRTVEAAVEAAGGDVRLKTWRDAAFIMRSEVERQRKLADDVERELEADKLRGVTYDACRRRIAGEYELMFEYFADGLADPTGRIREGEEASPDSDSVG